MQTPSPPTLVHRLLELATQRSIRVAFRFLVTGELDGPIERMTYGEVAERARSIARRLRAEGLVGERAVLLYPPGLDYVTAFFGCLHAGVIAVPAYPPDPGRLERTLPRLRALVRDCDAKVVLTLAPIQAIGAAMIQQAPELARLPWIATDQTRELEGGDDEVAPPDPEGVAFLQYTSGSTGDPRGVQVHHRNLVANAAMIHRAFAFCEDDVNLSWLPPYHDMGLIGGILQTVASGCTGVLMSPAAFLQRPLRWLTAIARLGGPRTVSGGPNFAYDLCVRRTSADERAALRLDHWAVAFNGAEPVRHATLERFAAAFAAAGLRRAALFPCYGLAESTLFASGGPSDAAPRSLTVDAAALAQLQIVDAAEGAALVSCGALPPGQITRIVDAERGTFCGPDEVGEIWLAGPHITGGYWGRAAETAATFGARLVDPRESGVADEGPFLRTGDLGFVHDDELYVVGRARDMIVIRGRNLWPQDIERTVEESHPSLRPGGAAAFAVDGDGGEGLGILAEVREPSAEALPTIVAAIQEAVTRAHGVAVRDLALIDPGQLPKTSSGKVRRRASRAALADGSLPLRLRVGGPRAVADPPPRASPSVREDPPMPVSLMFFSSDASASASASANPRAGVDDDLYALFLQASQAADRMGFEAIWIPERHFHPFGGLYPNPATLAAALAVTTRQIKLRAGSVVMPLHDPLRVAEEWAVVDRLSRGRVGLAFATGWNPNDFALAPERYAERRALTFAGIDDVRRLWRGEPLVRENGDGVATEVRTFPRPRVEPPLWLTCSGGDERFIDAGRRGYNVLTALLFQTPEQLAIRIRTYRRARAEAGHDPATGRVTLMMHTFVAESADAVETAVRAPLRDYLTSSVDLWRQGAVSLDSLDAGEREAVLDYAGRRYRERSALIGTPRACAAMLERVRVAGVDEVACLIDFGIEREAALESLAVLDRLRRGELSPPGVGPAPTLPRPAARDPEAIDLSMRILDEAERVLERPLPDGAATALLAAGLDSLLAVELSQRLGEVLQRPIPASIWFDYPTIADVAAHLVDGEREPPVTFDLVADAILPEDVDVAGKPIARTTAPTRALLTGVTGFLGAFLLRELLTQTEARVVCLVRAADAAAATARVRAVLESYDLWDDAYAGRIEGLTGDLAAPRLGLDEATFAALAASIDAIYHNGALVHFAHAYETCRAANVLGTLEVLRLACHGPRIVPVHHISTTAVFSHVHADEVVTPADDPVDHHHLDMGYSRSKWVAERLVIKARARGMPIAIYRPGLITGAATDGACHLTNFVWNMIRASVEIGVLPDYDRVLDMTPVDWAARAIVRSSRTPGAEGAILHLVNPQPTSILKLRDWLTARGYPMRVASFERWQVLVMQRVCATPSMSPLLPVLSLAAADFYARRQVRFDAPAASRPFEAIGDPCPPADERLLDTYRGYFVDRGFLPEAGRSRRPGAGAEALLRGQRLHEMVVEITGVTDLGGVRWREPLDVLLGDMRRQTYRPGGLERAITRLLLGLIRRARIVDARRRHPEIAAIPVAPPLFIAAPPRTGTTLLHNLLALDPERHAFALWEMMGPVTPRGATTGWEAHMIGVAREFVAETYERAPALRAIHPLDAERPDECHWLLTAGGASLVNAVMADAPGAIEWTLQADMTDAYRFHRAALQTLLWRRPGANLVCKDPWHLWHLDALLAVYPGARVILVHRDMREVVPSLCSLTRALRSVEADPGDDDAIGEFAIDLLSQGLQRAERVRAAAPGSFVDVDYRDLVADPIGAVRGLYHRLGRELSGAAEAAMRAFLADNPADRHGRHRYTLEMFGISPREVSARFAEYIERHLGPRP